MPRPNSFGRPHLHLGNAGHEQVDIRQQRCDLVDRGLLRGDQITGYKGAAGACLFQEFGALPLKTGIADAAPMHRAGVRQPCGGFRRQRGQDTCTHHMQGGSLPICVDRKNRG